MAVILSDQRPIFPARFQAADGTKSAASVPTIDGGLPCVGLPISSAS